MAILRNDVISNTFHDANSRHQVQARIFCSFGDLTAFADYYSKYIARNATLMTGMEKALLMTMPSVPSN